MKKRSENLTVGIPLYNGRATIKETLESISTQTILPYEVVIVDDCSECEYDDIFEQFENLNIRYIKFETNLGVGFVRNRLLDECKTNFLTMIDSDDIFMNSTFIGYMDVLTMAQDLNLIITGFCGENKDGGFIDYVGNLSWCHGKVYNVNTLRKYELRFLNQKTHEEGALNWNLSCIDKSKILEINFFGYLWKHNPNSITRHNDTYLYDNFLDYLNGLEHHMLFSINKPSFEERYLTTCFSMFSYYSLMIEEFGVSDKTKKYESKIKDIIKINKDYKKCINIDVKNERTYYIVNLYRNIYADLCKMYPMVVSKIDIFDFVKNIN